MRKYDKRFFAFSTFKNGVIVTLVLKREYFYAVLLSVFFQVVVEFD